ncbi:amidohydrolase family protein [bacterium]|nr:amidohydrolase family protein [bacterium]
MADASILLTAKWVVPVSSPPILDGAVLVEGPLIAAVGPGSDFAGWAGARESHDLLMPGLVNCHNHASMTAFRGLADDLPLKEWLRDHIFPAERRWGGERLTEAAFPLAMAEMVAGGTTCTADMYFFCGRSASLAATAGLRYVPAESIIDFPSPSFATVAEALALSRDLLDAWAGHPTVHPSVACHAPYTCSPATLAAGDALSREYGVPFQLHVAETRDEVAEMKERHGATPVRHLHALGLLSDRLLCAHAVHVDDEEADLLAAAGAAVAHDPESNMKLASGLAPVPGFLARGITVGLATDGPASNNDLDMFGEMRTCALVHKLLSSDAAAMPAATVLEMATLGSAKALGLGERIGSLERGKEADIVAVSLASPHATPAPDPVSHLVYAAKSSDVTHAWVRGRALLAAGRHTSVDVGAARDALLALAESIHG